MRHLFKGKYEMGGEGEGGVTLRNLSYHPKEQGTVKSIRSVDMVSNAILLLLFSLLKNYTKRCITSPLKDFKPPMFL